MMFLDAHLHAPDPDTRFPAEGAFWINSAAPRDWNTVVRLAAAHPNVRGFIGLHPWHIDQAPADWLRELRELLLAQPELGIGEIGLDQCGRHGYSLPRQQGVLQDQLRLAQELDRPVSLHCCRAYTALIEALQAVKRQPEAQLPGTSATTSAAATRATAGQAATPHTEARPLRGLVHHFAAGLPELQQLCGLGLHISFHPSLAEKDPGQQALLRHCPRDRLLLETDDQEGPDLARLQQHYDWAAEMLGITPAELAQQVRHNGTFYSN